METLESAANPADAPIVAPVADSADDIVDLEAQREAQAPAEGSEAKPEPEDDDELAKLALGSVDDAKPEDELAEVDYEGEKYKVPAPLKEALLRQADYTRKTMELAEQRKSVETMLKQAEEARNISVAKIEATTQARQLEAEIERLKATPIDGLPQETINALRLDLQAMEAQRATIAGDIQQLAALEAQKETEQFGKLRQECLAAAAKEVPNFTDARRTELETLAAKLGASPDEVAGITEPFAYKVLHFADIGMKYSERQRAAAQMKTAQAGNPAQKVAGRADGGKDAESMSMEEYIAARKSGKL